MSNLVFNMTTRGFLWNAIRALFGWIDVVVYTVFTWVMQLLLSISSFDTSQFGTFYGNIQQRVYAILSIFMLFKVVISIITYIVNPDTMTDKSQGAGKLVVRIIVVLIMLMFVCNPDPDVGAFKFLSKVQNDILEDGTIVKIVLGNNSNAASGLQNSSQKIGFDIYNGTFFSYDNKALEEIDGAPVDSIDDLIMHINDPVDGNNDEYMYTYYPIIGTAVGVIMDILIIGFCLDVAIRVFKLMILQLVAPIPIISYIDPKSSKDGTFSKWLKMVGSTWVEVFIRLFIIYFILLIAEQLVANGGSFVNNSSSPLVLVVLVIGLLFFAKDAPKFICDAIGIKSTGNLFSGFGKMLAAGAIGAGIVGSTVSNARASWMADTENGRSHLNPLNLMRNAGAAIFGGAIGGAVTGIRAGVNAKDHNARAVVEAVNKRNQQQLKYGAAGSTLRGRVLAGMQGYMTGTSPAESMKAREKELSDAMKELNDYKSTVESRFDGNETFMMTDTTTGASFNWAKTERLYQSAINGDASAIGQIDTIFGGTNGSGLDYLRNNYDDIHKAGYEEFSNAVMMDPSIDSVVTEKYKNLRDKTSDVTVNTYDKSGNVTGRVRLSRSIDGRYKNTKENSGNTTNTRGELVRSSRYKAAMANSEQSR